MGTNEQGMIQDGEKLVLFFQNIWFVFFFTLFPCYVPVIRLYP